MNNRNDLKILLSKIKSSIALRSAINSSISKSPEDARILTQLLINDSALMSKFFLSTTDMQEILSNMKDEQIPLLIFNAVLSNDQLFSRVFADGIDVNNFIQCLNSCKTGTSKGYQIDALTVDRCTKQLKERVCEPQQWKRLASKKSYADKLYQAFPDLREVRKNSRVLAQVNQPGTLSPLSIFSNDVLKLIAGESRSENTTKESASTIVNESFKKPPTKGGQ